MIKVDSGAISQILGYRQSLCSYAETYITQLEKAGAPNAVARGTQQAMESFLDIVGMRDTPCGLSAPEVSWKIWDAAEQFQKEYAEGITLNDFRKQLHKQTEAMTDENALRFALLLQEASSFVDPDTAEQYLDFTPPQPSMEALERKVDNLCANPGEKSVRQRVTEILDQLTGDVLACPILYAGNAMRRGKPEDLTLQTVIESLQTAHKDPRADHALSACALYISIIQGQIPGVSPKTNPAGLTLFYSAKCEAMEIYRSLDASEITQIEAETSLRNLKMGFSRCVANLLSFLLGASELVGGVIACFTVMESFFVLSLVIYISTIAILVMTLDPLYRLRDTTEALLQDLFIQSEIAARYRKDVAAKARAQEKAAAAQCH